MKKTIIVLLLIFSIYQSFSQGVAIGSWRSHVGLSDAFTIVDAGDKIFCASRLGLFSVDKTDKSYEQFSKANGLNDVGISTMAWNTATKTLLIAYSNSNIDAITPNGIINISDIKNKSLPGDKAIYQITMNGDNAYLSCGFGIVNINLSKLEIEDTYIIGDNGTNVVTQNIVFTKDNIWALTSKGIKYASNSSNLLSNYAVWNKLNTALKFDKIIAVDDSIFLKSGDSIFMFQPHTNIFQLKFYNPSIKILHLNQGNHHALVSIQNSNSDSSKIKLYDKAFNFIQSIYIHAESMNNTDVVEDVKDKSIWVSDKYIGLFHYQKGSVEKLVPNSIHYNSVQTFVEKNNELWVPGGSLNDGYHYSYNGTGFYSFINEEWNTIDKYSKPALDTVFDLVCAAFSPVDEKIYFGSFGWGLVEYDRSNGELKVYKKNNSTLSNTNGDLTSVRVADVAFDSDNNLWMTNYGATNGVVVKKADGVWNSFRIPIGTSNFGKLIVDKNNQLWMTTHEVGGTTGGGGIVVFNRGNDVDNTKDDTYRNLVKGGGSGNLPSNNVYAIAEDKDGQIWIGTDVGITVVSNAADIIKGGDAQQIIVSNPTDSIAAYLFSSEVISDIKVDGANRKWVSSTHGVWLMSADGTKEIYHFNQDNSPLLSDRVSAIGINNTTGEVFFATDNGVCSFKGTATGGGEKNENVLVFPNPIPHNYVGTIAVRGLVDNAFVKITDINGQLIYSTKALGGQAIWDGKNLKGEKTSTGVYLVFCTNADGTETTVAKILYEK
jgi:hypothetical protein